MKVAFFIPSLSNRGPNVFTVYLIKSLVNFGYVNKEDITVFYFKSCDNSLVFPCSTRKFRVSEVFELRKYDILHSTMFLPDLFVSLCSMFRGGTVCGLHNEIRIDTSFLYGNIKAFIVSRLWELSLGQFSHLVMSSNSMREYYKRLGVKNKSSIIPYGVPKDENLYYCNVPDNDKFTSLKNKYTVLGTCGLLIERKNHTILLDFLSNNLSYALILIGDGPLELDLREKSASLGLSERVIFTGFVDNSIQYYKYFDIYISPSYSEGFGLAMLNAISFDIPICTSELDIYKGFFSVENSGLFQPRDLNSMTDAIERVKRDLNGYSISAKQLYSDFFSLASMGKLHFNLYEKVLTMESNNE